MLRPRHTHPREITNPFDVIPQGCPSCGRYLHPLPLGAGPTRCPDCRLRGRRR